MNRTLYVCYSNLAFPLKRVSTFSNSQHAKFKHSLTHIVGMKCRMRHSVIVRIAEKYQIRSGPDKKVTFWEPPI